MKRLLATATTAAVIVGSAAAAGATDPTPLRAQRSQATASSDAQRSAAHSTLLHRAIREGIRIAAETIGVEPREVITAARSGESISALAAAHDVDRQTIIDALVTAANERIDEAVAAGKVDEERAARIRSRAAAGTARFVDATRPPPAARIAGDGARRSTLRHRVIMSAIRISAQTIGVAPPELHVAYREGKSVGDVATEHGVDPQAVTDALITAANERIAEGVADGRLDAERAARFRDRVPELAERFVGATRRVRA